MLDNQIVSVKEILELEASNQKIEVKGWIRNKRGSKKTSFLSQNNSAFIEHMYIKYVNNDPSLPESWKKYFQDVLFNVFKEMLGYDEYVCT